MHGPSRVEWAVAVMAVILQQEGAFVSVPAYFTGASLRGVVNPFNTFGIAFTGLALLALCIPRWRQIASAFARTPQWTLFLVLVLASACWSIHPDLTVRRAAGYVLTAVLACYLTVRFGRDDCLRVFSASFAASAIGSLAIVLLFPAYGVMDGQGLMGDWRGVFPHKNVLGPVMAVAVFVELYLLTLHDGRPRWRWGLLALYLSLVIFSHSATGWFLAALYIGTAALFQIWRHHQIAAALAALVAVIAMVGLAATLWTDPRWVLSAIGKDPTLTGRTTLWRVVLEFIHEKPMLGWGYHAMWEPLDPTTIYADRLTGNWGVTSSHNTFLEITLQLGFVGLGLMVLILLSAWRRAVRCCRRGIVPFGWFAFVFFLSAVIGAQFIETLGQNQVIEWLLFSALLLTCGAELRPLRPLRPDGPPRLGECARRPPGANPGSTLSYRRRSRLPGTIPAVPHHEQAGDL